MLRARFAIPVIVPSMPPSRLSKDTTGGMLGQQLVYALVCGKGGKKDVRPWLRLERRRGMVWYGMVGSIYSCRSLCLYGGGVVRGEWNGPNAV